MIFLDDIGVHRTIQKWLELLDIFFYSFIAAKVSLINEELGRFHGGREFNQ